MSITVRWSSLSQFRFGSKACDRRFEKWLFWRGFWAVILVKRLIWLNLCDNQKFLWTSIDCCSSMWCSSTKMKIFTSVQNLQIYQNTKKPKNQKYTIFQLWIKKVSQTILVFQFYFLHVLSYATCIKFCSTTNQSHSIVVDLNQCQSTKSLIFHVNGQLSCQVHQHTAFSTNRAELPGLTMDSTTVLKKATFYRSKSDDLPSATRNATRTSSGDSSIEYINCCKLYFFTECKDSFP